MAKRKGAGTNICTICGGEKEETRPNSNTCRSCDHGGGRKKTRLGFWLADPVYLVMVAETGARDKWYPFRAGRGGLDIVAHISRTDARVEARRATYLHGRGNVIVTRFRFVNRVP